MASILCTTRGLKTEEEVWRIWRMTSAGRNDMVVRRAGEIRVGSNCCICHGLRKLIITIFSKEKLIVNCTFNTHL